MGTGRPITENNYIAEVDSVDNNTINDTIGNKEDSANDTVDVASAIALLRQIAEAVNNGTGTAIGSNLSLVDLLGAFDGGADPQGDIFQALGVDTTDSIKDILDAIKGAGWTDENLTTIDSLIDAIKLKTDNLPTDTDAEIVELKTELQAVKGDYEKFTITSADGDTDRWTPDYVNGTEGGSADINTTTTNKAFVKVDPDATPTAAAYTLKHDIPLRGKKWRVIVDVNTTFGTQSTSWAAVGLRVSKTTYDNDNIIYIERQESSDGVNERITAGSNFNGAGATENYATDANDNYSFMIERNGNEWKCYYSLTQAPDYKWVLLGSYTDGGYLAEDVAIHLLAYSPGNADTQTAQGDFSEFIYQPNFESSEYEGDFSYLDAGGEQTLIEITPTTNNEVKGIWLEMDNLTQDGAIKFYYKIDGTNYRELNQFEYSFVVADNDDYLFIPCNVFINDDFKVTYTEGVDEGADRAISYELIVKNVEV